MAEAPIQSSQVFAKGLLKDLIRQFKQASKETAKFEKDLVKVLKTQEKIRKVNQDPKTGKQLKTVNDSLTKSVTIRKEINVVQKQQVSIKKSINNLTVAELKNNIRRQQQQKAIKSSLMDIIALENKNIGTLKRINIESKKLRKERENLNLDTAKGTKRLKEINKQLDLNNKKILDNSDKLKKQRLNVGNYTDSIKEAAGASGLFTSVLGPLNAATEVLNALLKKNTVEEEVNTVAKESNTVATVQVTTAQKAMNVATGAGTKALRIFKVALASTGIGLLLIALGGLVAFFTRSQDGVDSLSTSMAGLGAAVDVIIDRFAAVGDSLVKVFKGIASFDLDLIKEGIKGIGDAFKGIGIELEQDIKLAKQLKELTITLTREEKLFEAEQAKTLTQIKELTVITKDKLAADQDRLKAVKEINNLEIELTTKQLALQERALAASLDSLTADKERLGLGPEQIDFVERIKNGQIDAAEAVKLAADFTLSSAAGEEALFNIIDKIVAQEQARQSLLDKQATTAKRTASITQQIANKNSTALLQESAAQKELFKDQDAAIANRITFIEKARDLEIEAFRVRARANLINETELQAVILKLNVRTQAQIDKLFEIRDAKERARRAQLEKELQEGLAAIERDVQAEIDLKETELLELETLNRKGIENEQDIADKELEIQQAKLDQVVNNEKSTFEEIRQAQAEFDALQVDQAEEQADKLKEIRDQERDEIFQNLTAVTQQVGQELAKRSEAEITSIDKAIGENAKAIDRQAQLAAQGLDNQLVFEEEKAAKLALKKRDAEEKAAREQELIQLTELYFNSLNARLRNATQQSETDAAPFLAAKDVFLAKGIAKGLVQFAAEGEDKVKGIGTSTSDSNPFMLSVDEGVVKASANIENPGVVRSLNDGSFSNMFMPKHMFNQANGMLVKESKKIDPMIAKYDKMISVMESIDKKPVYQSWIDQYGTLTTTIHRKGMKEVIKQMAKPKRIW